MKTIIKTAATVFALALLSTGVFAADTHVKKDTTNNQVTAYVSYSPEFNMVGVDVNIDKATEGESTVTIYDAAGNVLLTDTFENASAEIKKNYLLDAVNDGDYTIKVTTVNGAVEHALNLNKVDTDLQAFAF